jgi:pectate disaccharide-lyase
VDVVGFDITSDPPAEVDGIAISGSYSRAIGNRVHDLARPCRPSGGIVAGDAAYTAHDIAIIGNYVHDIGQGPRDGSCSLLHGLYAAVPGVVVANNVVVRVLGDGITSWHAATRLRIVNNTVVDSGQDGILIGNGDAGGSEEGNTGSYVANNILAFNAGDAISESGPRNVSNQVVANIFYGNGRDIFDQWGGSDESSTLVDDPMFADRAADDFRPLPGSPALGSGTAVGAPTTDFLGAPRGVTISRGAFENAVPEP